MNEFITLQASAFANPSELAAFRDILQDTIASQGSSGNVAIGGLSLQQTLEGTPLVVEWSAEYRFTTPDNRRVFSDTSMQHSIRLKNLDHAGLMQVLAVRSQTIAEAYRDALRGIYNLSADIKSGAFELEAGTDPIEYLRDTLEAAIAAFPNSN